jgi:hypothetical protein
VDAIQRFAQYAADFEKVFQDDDWSLLEPYFTEDAVYHVNGGPPFGGRWEGRQAVFDALKRSLDNFDRRCAAREPQLTGGPELRDGQVWIGYRVTYRVDGAPALELVGEETARFEGDRIAHLEDRFADEAVAAAERFLAEHAGKLRPVGG